MAHIYTNETTGQVITAGEPLSNLEGKARWVHTEGDAPKDTTPVEIPEGNPEESWNHAQLDAYAEKANISLEGAKTKAEKVGLIERHKPGQPVDNGPSVEGQGQSFPEPGTPAP